MVVIVSQENTIFFDRSCRPIMMKPKPAAKPSTPEPASPAPSGGESPQATENGQAGTASEDPQPAAEPMETDKPESGPSSA